MLQEYFVNEQLRLTSLGAIDPALLGQWKETARGLLIDRAKRPYGMLFYSYDAPETGRLWSLNDLGSILSTKGEDAQGSFFDPRPYEDFTNRILRFSSDLFDADAPVIHNATFGLVLNEVSGGQAQLTKDWHLDNEWLRKTIPGGYEIAAQNYLELHCQLFDCLPGQYIDLPPAEEARLIKRFSDPTWRPESAERIIFSNQGALTKFAEESGCIRTLRAGEAFVYDSNTAVHRGVIAPVGIKLERFMPSLSIDTIVRNTPDPAIPKERPANSRTHMMLAAD